MKPKPASKGINEECWLNSCHLKGVHKYQFGNKEVLICNKHFKAFKFQEEIEKEKRDGKRTKTS
jgi:hypothetical protein